MSFGDVDTFNLLFDKLQNLLNDSQGYYESFLDANNLYKQGKMSDKEFFEKLGDYVVAYSALEFLAVKVIFELKKSVDKIAGGSAPTTQVTGSVSMGGFGSPSSTHISSATMPGPGRPPSIVSAASAFGNPGTLPTPDPSLLPQSSSGPSCSSCGAPLKSTAKFCTKCGKKV
ncbi:MAG: zinc-ribbon domain-containing protein [Thaumarchaeota archaeon]|nr:zinc-ribbon domain-containing protein [Nitrososphaerota archaeon]